MRRRPSKLLEIIRQGSPATESKEEAAPTGKRVDESQDAEADKGSQGADADRPKSPAASKQNSAPTEQKSNDGNDDEETSSQLANTRKAPRRKPPTIPGANLLTTDGTFPAEVLRAALAQS